MINLNNEPTLLFAGHHKSGSLMSHLVSGCFTGANKVDQHWCSELGGEVATYQKYRGTGSGRIVHFMRDLSSLVLSAYLYHKHTGERWSLALGSASAVLRDSVEHHFEYNDHESYTDYLLRSPFEKGVLAEMVRFQHGSKNNEAMIGDFRRDNGLDEIERALQTCKVNAASCITVCLEDFVEAYTDTWEKVFQFAGVIADQVRWQCVADHNLKGETGAPHSHVTHGMLSHAERMEILERIRRIDTDIMGGRMLQVSRDNPCSRFAENRNSTSSGDLFYEVERFV